MRSGKHHHQGLAAICVTVTLSNLTTPHQFKHRHIGPSEADSQAMLATVQDFFCHHPKTFVLLFRSTVIDARTPFPPFPPSPQLGFGSMDELIESTIPSQVRMNRKLGVGEPQGEQQTLAQLRAIADKNVVMKNFIGMGYYGTVTPGVILRNIMENPGYIALARALSHSLTAAPTHASPLLSSWYTSYTPYQAEISQGRLESLLNYQVSYTQPRCYPVLPWSPPVDIPSPVCPPPNRRSSLTSLACPTPTPRCWMRALPLAKPCPWPMSFSSASAASSLPRTPFTHRRLIYSRYLHANHCAPTLLVNSCSLFLLHSLQTRAGGLGFDLVVGDVNSADFSSEEYFGVMVQYPDTYGVVDSFGRAQPTSQRLALHPSRFAPLSLDTFTLTGPQPSLTEALAAKAHEHNTQVVAATDLLALTLMQSPGDWGADIAVGTAQRFGVPMGFGGPHAGFLATRSDRFYIAKMPGRIIGTLPPRLSRLVGRLLPTCVLPLTSASPTRPFSPRRHFARL